MLDPMRRLVAAVCVLVSVACLSGRTAQAADLQPRASAAYDAYLAEAKRTFLARAIRDAAPATVREGILSVAPAREDGIIEVDGGLVHHWIGSAFITGATLRQVVDISSAYSNYPSMYKEVLAAKLLGRQDDTYRVQMRLRESGGGITATLDVRSNVQYFRPTSRSAYSISTADEIREVRNAGTPGEQLLPAGHDSGYLWRANTFSYMEAASGGVY